MIRMLRCLFPLAVFAMSTDRPPPRLGLPCADARITSWFDFTGSATWDVTGRRAKKPSAAAGSNRGWAIASSTNTWFGGGRHHRRKLRHLQRRDRAGGSGSGSTGGNRLHLVGGFVLRDAWCWKAGTTSPDADSGIVERERIAWTPNADGGVRQLWESIKDDGENLGRVVRPAAQGHDAGSQVARNEKAGFRRALRGMST
ncbi:MAG: hypothetical protein U1F20_09195 [Lysobacterales bacterium]